MRAVSITAASLAFSACAGPTASPEAKETGDESQACAEGFYEGDCAPDFTLPEASGDPLALSDHAGDVVVVASEAMW